MGKINPHQLSTVLEDQIRKRLMDGFGLSKGKFYYTDTNLLKLEVMYNINPLQVIYDAVEKSIVDDSEISNLLNNNNTIISRRWGLAQDIATLKFSSTKELKLANSIKKAKSIGELISISPLDEENTKRFILFLHTAEFIDLRDESSQEEQLEDIIITNDPAASEPDIDEEVEELELEIIEDSQLEKLEPSDDKVSSEQIDQSTKNQSSENNNDFKIEINFPGAEQPQAKEPEKGADDNEEQIVDLEDNISGEKTKVLSSDEIERIRAELTGSDKKDSTEKDSTDSVSDFKLDFDPDQFEGKSTNKSNLQADPNELKLEIELPPLDGDLDSQQMTPDNKSASNNKGPSESQKQMSGEHTQELNQEEIEELRKLTIRKK